jgi:hypothetical protein
VGDARRLFSSPHPFFWARRLQAWRPFSAFSDLLDRPRLSRISAHLFTLHLYTNIGVNATSRETLIEGFVNIARLLALPTKDEHDQNRTVASVQQWLATHTDWLLIMGNADDSTLVTEFLPPGDTGHILLTTREQAWGLVARTFEVEKMDETEGILFLLRRAKILNSPSTPLSEASCADQVKAAAIVKAMDGKPTSSSFIKRAGEPMVYTSRQ